MANTKITITFDSEKIAAIKQFAPEDMQSINQQLTEHLEKVYSKVVPSPVRQYIDGKEKNAPKIKSSPRKKEGLPQRGEPI